MATFPLLTRFIHVPLTRNSTRSPRRAAATTASPLGQRRAATEIHGRIRWRATQGCTTSRHFPLRNPCDLKTETSWQWSTAGSPLCLHSAACCKNSTEPCHCPSGPVLIQTQEENLAASHFPETAGCTLSWLPPPLHQIRGNPSTISWIEVETQVRLSQ